MYICINLSISKIILKSRLSSHLYDFFNILDARLYTEVKIGSKGILVPSENEQLNTIGRLIYNTVECLSGVRINGVTFEWEVISNANFRTT